MAYKSARVVDSKKTDDRSAGGRPHSGRQLPATPAVPEDAANEALSKLSHDIRTQLYIIIGFAELMLEEVPGKINEEQRRNLNDVLTSGKRLQDLLNDIVTRSKGAQNRKGL